MSSEGELAAFAGELGEGAAGHHPAEDGHGPDAPQVFPFPLRYGVHPDDLARKGRGAYDALLGVLQLDGLGIGNCCRGAESGRRDG